MLYPIPVILDAYPLMGMRNSNNRMVDDSYKVPPVEDAESRKISVRERERAKGV